MKKFSIMILMVLFVITSVPCAGFANTETNGSSSPISDVSAFKEEVNALAADGNLSEAEQQYLAENTDSEVVDDFVSEKMDEAVAVLNDESLNEDLTTLEDGQEYKREVYDLGDGCELIVELEDRAEEIENGIAAYATSGSNTLWKEYGYRYFTASATVSFSLGSATLKLRNHYTLSSKGIDERKGVGTAVYETDDGSVSVAEPVITDSIARTVGESDVNMYCNYTLNYSGEDGYAMSKKYKMKSNVGFVDIDKSAEKVKVKQSWSLTRI